MPGPLGEDHLAMLDQGLAAIKQAKDDIALAKRAGIDVSQHEADIAATESKLRQIKQVYFPGR